MASESSDDAGVSVSLPADVAAWLDRTADDLGVDRETVVVQLIASYRAAEEFDDEEVTEALDIDIESQVRDIIAERLPDIADAVGERVAQVKRATDGKAEADHTHPEFGELATLSTAVDDLESALASLESRVEDAADDAAAVDDRVADVEDDVSDRETRLSEMEGAMDRLDEVADRLQTVAWVVSDLREAEQARSGGSEAVDRLKQTAAELDVDRAVCGNCSEAVDLALLQEPRCPHCEATVSDVQLPGGIFGKPKLTVARQLEPGEGTEGRSNIPDAADRG
jgi:uncharacterized protein (DUF3084 family)